MDSAIAMLLAGLVAQPLLFFLLVVGLTILLEDATALAVGTLGAAMQVDPVLALGALLVGTIAGDALLHALGRAASRHPFVVRRVEASPRARAAGRSIWLVALARFIPGLRLPAYLGSGVARMSPVGFGLAIVLTALLWTPLLYFAPALLQAAGFGLLPLALFAVALLLTPPLVRRLSASRHAPGA